MDPPGIALDPFPVILVALVDVLSFDSAVVAPFRVH